MKTKSLLISGSILLSALSLPSYALVDATQTALAQEREVNQERIAEFSAEELALKQRRDALAAQKAALDAEIEALSTTFGENEIQIAEQQKLLDLESGSLGELFGIVRQTAKELDATLSQSVVFADQPAQLDNLNTIVEANALPTIAELNALWQTMVIHAKNSGTAAAITVPVVDGNGVIHDQTVVRIGDLGLLGEQGYLSWDGTSARYYGKQPADLPSLNEAKSLGDGVTFMPLDPSRGDIIARLADNPSLLQRIAQGGFVGKVIIALLLIGLGIALYRGFQLFTLSGRISKQLKTPDTPNDNNPLGRILNVYQEERFHSTEALELRLLEQVLDEQQGLEQGLSMIKLLAAMAPMLGLLGTVTGMIETFQVITQYGNGDPTIMAGGISMALITTVLGLVAAMPLLLAHNLLSTKVDNLRNLLEKQGIGLVAQRAEMGNSKERVAA
uniref:MotA/TolQ/ExbB proton channel family protein n=1 Tax=Thaumasiovibrio occultus TaxID=1891184 RepID=UPI000B363F1D|nr:MotA/TolQ/ExbB proton channel family protein [Thaumasiovibrio occultus]